MSQNSEPSQLEETESRVNTQFINIAYGKHFCKKNALVSARFEESSVPVEPGVMAAQNFKRNLTLILCREGEKKPNTCNLFLLLLKRERNMSATCGLFPPLGDPWPSCLLPSQE